MANCKELEQQSLSLEADIRNLQMGKRFLEQRFENVYESSKMQRDYLKKKLYETEQSAFKLFNSQHNIYKNHLEEYLHTKKGKSRLRDLIEDEDAEEKTTATWILIDIELGLNIQTHNIHPSSLGSKIQHLPPYFGHFFLFSTHYQYTHFQFIHHVRFFFMSTCHFTRF